MDTHAHARSVNVVIVFNEFDYNVHARMRADTRVFACSVNGALYLGKLRTLGTVWQVGNKLLTKVDAYDDCDWSRRYDVTVTV